MKEIDILNELYLVIKAKREAIKAQKYSEAADCRDRERELEKELIEIIEVKGIEISYLYSNLENIDRYFLQKYNVNYGSLFDENNFTQFMRELKLKNLGI